MSPLPCYELSFRESGEEDRYCRDIKGILCRKKWVGLEREKDKVEIAGVY